MSREQRERHLERVTSVSLTLHSTQSHVHPAFCVDLPISPEEFQSGLKVPLGSIEGIWKKASELVSDTAAISPAPGYGPECKMVVS